MGCIVNGPGESKHANIGISLPGTGEAPAAPVFVDGKKFRTLRGPTIATDFKALVIDYIDQRYGGAAAPSDAVTGGGVSFSVVRERIAGTDRGGWIALRWRQATMLSINNDRENRP